jgi:hypothetical protein
VTDNKSSDNKLSDTSKVNVVEPKVPNVSTDEPEIGAKITYVNPNNL